MAQVFGQLTYTGITGVLSASCTFTQGISPSVTSVSVPYDPYLASTIQRTGTVRWKYANSVIRELPDCAIDSIDLNTSGGQNVWDITILDRRWMWRGGYITGNYNEPVDGENSDMFFKRKKNPRELATLCLEAMGEEGFDVSVLPTADYPYVDWMVANPSEALADICDQYSCVVNMRRDNTVNIVKIGQGMSLPPTTPINTRLYKHQVFDPAELPSKIVCVSAPVEYGVDLPLKMVMLEEDGEVVDADEVSYLPETNSKGDPVTTWEELGGSFEDIEDLKVRDLAETTYGKLWQIDIDKIKDRRKNENTEGICWIDKVLFPGEEFPDYDTKAKCDEGAGEWEPTGDFDVGKNKYFPNSIYVIETLDQILPINSSQMETIGKGTEKALKESIVYGKFFKGDPIGVLPEDAEDIDTDNDPRWFSKNESAFIYRQSFSVDEEQGLVRFEEAVQNWDSAPGTRDLKRAILRLRCIASVRDKDTREPMRYRQELVIDPTSKMQPLYDVRDDIVFRYWRDPEPSDTDSDDGDEGNDPPEGMEVRGFKNNETKVNNALKYYLEGRLIEFQERQTMSAAYTGFVPTETDGKIRQVSFTIGGDGTATSNAEWNRENEDVSLTYKEMRQRQVHKEMLKLHKLKKRNNEPSAEELKKIKKRIVKLRTDGFTT